MSEILCTDCSKKDSCSAYEILNNTLDNNKVHKKIFLQLNFIVTLNEPEEFPIDWEEDISQDIAENAVCFMQFVTEKLEEYNNVAHHLAAHLDVKNITNKQAFEEMTKFIKETHEQASNG